MLIHSQILLIVIYLSLKDGERGMIVKQPVG